MPEDRIFYVGARANAAFSTRPFEMPSEPLLLNAAMPFSPHGAGMFDQSYIMAELVDPEHRTIEGYEREKCVLREIPTLCTRMKWGRLDGTELAGRTVRLRIHLRDARVYSIASARSRGMERNEVFHPEI